MPVNLAKDEKLTITAFTTAKRSGMGIRTIKVNINPQGFSRRHEHRYGGYRGINSSKNTALYAYSLSEELNLKLLFVDGSVQDYGLSALSGESKSVPDQIKEFIGTCYTMNGDIHEPNFLNIKWGDVNFDCKLKTLDIKYTSFESDGRARKAELDVIFIEDIPKDKIAKLEGKSSPDLTHIITVKAGDTLPLLTEKVYGSEYKNLYLEVARVNRLDHFRVLNPGQRIFFPPLDK
ncbi:hypothetical protein KK083_19340 [Fulvivirgaceae bacterium PWU4]|uniref:LysM domain-containing protein n=1 Tax=Chryseosolibacter histidini TaxID=2782349 RepID=A0AAP2DPN7_9BACT|nr:hypothetical protein [Chryseosolibacter histidini]MBT1699058.1 hypothetical protein [Chryseosolibacter histidini]